MPSQTRAAKRHCVRPGASCLHRLPLDVLHDVLMPMMSLQDAHVSFASLCRAAKQEAASRPVVTQTVTKRPSVRIPPSWLSKMQSMVYKKCVPPSVRFPPLLKKLGIVDVECRHWMVDGVSPALLSQLTHLCIRNCKIDGFSTVHMEGLIGLTLRHSIIHDGWGSDAGLVDLSSMVNLEMLSIQGCCDCTHVLIGEVFSICKKLLSLEAAVRMNVQLEKGTHDLPLLRRLYFAPLSDNLIQCQADVLPSLLPVLEVLEHPDVRAPSLAFLDRFAHLRAATVTQTLVSIHY